ncbi:MAG: zinc metallopeptidase [Erysipelotrichaceae bacterium]|nr:zinc metallopeptidase [Erysipelotrichaceae bacterium]
MDDYTTYYMLTFLAFAITMSAQLYIKIIYSRYSRIRCSSGFTGARTAAEILLRNGITDVRVVQVAGYLSDHYDPRNSTVSLSQNNYANDSLASIAVASHECGHVLQDKENYAFLKIREKIIPVVSFSSFAGYIAIMVGILFELMDLIWMGIFMECIILAFQIITLPIEFDASRRALAEIENYGFVSVEELKGARKVLTAAALTYVAGVASTVLEIMRLVIMFGGRRRDD